MSVARIAEIAKRFAAVSGRAVHYEPGWEWRGNGQTSAYEGIVNHHTATGYANQNLGVLINGRPDLDGPLCNFCTWPNGDIGVIAAHPANHAGASGGYNTAPLPNTGAFNKFVIGNEIIYPGNSPMTPEQYRSATILSRIAVDVVGWGDPARVKAHAETSVTGKWDPGYAPGKTIDMSAFRRDVRNATTGPVPPPAPQPPPPPPPPRSTFPLPAGHYFGLITGPAQSHGGYYPNERGWVRSIQQALIRKGYVPGITNPASGWADGLFEQATADAVTRFQRREMPGTQYFGQVWGDDWARLGL